MTDLSRRLVISGLAGTVVAVPAAAGAGQDLLPSSAMRDDVALLRRAYEVLHPGLWRYATPATLDERFDALDAATSSAQSRAAFYLLLSRFLAEIRCGHTYANFYNQPPAIAAALFEAADRLPFDFLWRGDDMIVTADPFVTGIKPGTAILAIDGRPAASVLAALMPFARADGHNDAKRRRLLSVQGNDHYQTFDVFFSLLFGRGQYRLDVEGLDGRRRSVVVQAVSLAQRRESAHARLDATGDKPVWAVERRGDAALLTMPTWSLYDGTWDWKGWLEDALDRLAIERVRRLVVDLRANEGGLDCGNVIAARLVRQPTPCGQGRRLVRYRIAPADLRPYLDTWDRSFDRLGENAVKVDDRFYLLNGSDEIIAPSGRRFEGDVRVLTGPQNSSATFQFVEFLRCNHLATLVGEPTGGNRRGINGGCFYFLRLPATGLEADLPLVGRFPTEPQPDGGVEPDIVVPITREQVATGRDEPMLTALG